MTKLDDTEENSRRCICPECPTFLADECPKEKMEGLYCAKGRSGCDMVRKGCVCGNCSVWKESNLSKGYFCINGEAK